MDETVAAIAKTVSGQLLEQGAKATLLTGSQARGTARPQSDIDIFAIGDGPDVWSKRVEDHMVVVYWWEPDEARQRMYRPESALLAVGGWRQAVVLDDPYGIAAKIQRDAKEWSWERIANEADAWVAEELTVWAEYVQKLVTALENDRKLDVAAIRAETALRLSRIFAVHRRVESESENGFWETTAEVGGPEWRDAQERAFGANGEDVGESAAAALTLYALLVEDARDLLDDRQREVVERALGVARAWKDEPTSR